VDVAVRRQQRVELARLHSLLTGDLQTRPGFILPVVEPRVRRVELRAAVDADEPPRQMVVTGVDEPAGTTSENRQSSPASSRYSAYWPMPPPISRSPCPLRKLIRQPAVRREQPRKRRTQRLDAAAWSRIVRDNRRVSSINVRISGTSTMKPKFGGVLGEDHTWKLPGRLKPAPTWDE